MAFEGLELSNEDILKRRIADAVKEVELSEMPAWADLDILSTHTRVEGLDVEPEAVVLGENGTFSGVVNIYVSLQYGSDSDDGFTSSDSFLGEFNGHFDGEDPIIDDVTVDTSEFYT